ncbi:MAG TPA: TetR/AcrR family transcriptional regulator [Acidimicrobiales bacterium]
MTAPSVATRDRILDAAAASFMLHGYAGTGMKRLVADAAAPFGSIYHFFPGGKEQLAVEAVERAGAGYHDLVLLVFDAEDEPVAGIRAVFEGAAVVLGGSGYADACPIATVALEVASTNEPLRQATDRVFASWLATITSRLVDAGVAVAAARDTAIAVVSLLEGGFLLSRAARSPEAMLANGRAAVALVEAALA